VVTIGTIVLILASVLFIKMRRQMRIDKGIRAAQGDADVALRRIKSRLNYTAQLLNNERERAGYDRVRLSDDDARSIATVLHEAETQYTACSQRLDATLRTLPKTPDEASYRAVLAVIDDITPLIPPIEEALQRGIQLRTGIEARINERTAHIDEARTAHLALAHRLNALGITHVRYGTEDKAPAAQEMLQELGLDCSHAAYMGDDWPDMLVMMRVAFACAPSNAHMEVKAIAHYVTEREGGHGAAREFCDLLLVASGHYAKLLKGYTT
jgi:YrbI family 3-deoxy-D-manno-octulosonate 8-phosphate phosphatase